MSKSKETSLGIDFPNTGILDVRIKGKTSLIVKKFGSKAQQQLIDSQGTSKKTKNRAERDPEAEYQDCFHKLSDGETNGFPAVGFAKAMIAAVRLLDGMKMTEAKQMFAVYGLEEPDLVTIEGDDPVMKCDHVRLANGSTDIRYRPYFHNWEANLRIEFDCDQISLKETLAVLQRAGSQCGVGEWRKTSPKSYGNHGLWNVAHVIHYDSFKLKDIPNEAA